MNALKAQGRTHAMFGNANKIKLDPALIARCKQIETELALFEGASSDADITEKLRGLGYIS
jgi:hypothetical protein